MALMEQTEEIKLLFFIIFFLIGGLAQLQFDVIGKIVRRYEHLKERILKHLR